MDPSFRGVDGYAEAGILTVIGCKTNEYEEIPLNNKTRRKPYSMYIQVVYKKIISLQFNSVQNLHIAINLLQTNKQKHVTAAKNYKYI